MIATVRLDIFIEDGLDSGQEELLRRELESLAPEREWLVSKPAFCWVDTDTSEEEFCDDEPAGGVSAFVAEGRVLDPDTDKQSLGDAQVFLDWASRVARDNTLVFSVEYDGEVVGEISPSGPDKGVTDGLLQPWRAKVYGAV